MIKTFHWSGSGAVAVVVISLSLVQAVFADEPCGNIITTSDGEEFSEPIEDCDFPFGPIQTNETLEVFFQDTQLENGGTYPIAGQIGSVLVPNVTPSTFGTIYKHRGNDYVVMGHTFGELVTFTAGAYSIYVSEMDLILSDGYLDTLKNFLLPTAYAAPGNTTLITFTVTEPIPEPEPVDPLILQYAPILYFHPQEDYFPMDVNTFIEASSLWEINPTGDDALLKSANDLTFEAFESIIDTGINTDDMYLAFSSPDTPRTIDLQRARSTYAAMRQSTPTVYYHKMTDTTDYGKTFTVLQYWYFYAMNNWKEKVGGAFTNNHEGDWESTFVFLNDDVEPKYVAYSSHLNDGLPQYLNGQYSSVRRAWNSEDVEKDEDRIKDYVALGSHANYPNNGEGGIQKISFQKDDVTSDSGVIVDSFTLNSISSSWAGYQGLWGTFTNKEGFDGPQGPTHINVTTQTRYIDPIAWAGLNNPFKLAVNTATDTIEDTKQGIKMVFDTILSIGTNLVIERYNEYITFGANIAEFNPLPFFFEVTSDTETSGLTMTLSYDPDYLESTGQLAEDLVILYYNPATDLFEVLESVVDMENNTVTAYTPHMSRYLLGFQEKEVVEELEIPETATTTKSSGSRTGTRINRSAPQVLGISTTTEQGQVEQIAVLIEVVEELLNGQDDLTKMQRGVLTEVLKESLRLLEFFR